MQRDAYRDAGVDIDAGDALVERIKPHAKSTHRAGVIGGIGGFGGLFSLMQAGRWKDPILVSGTDGVGTKLLVAQKLGRHDTIGVDLVAMCVNDIAVAGAEPLFFLDYFATGKLAVAEAVIAGIADGCRRAGCALIGGETAEMPGMYGPGHYDLAGFAVGVVERDAVMDGSTIDVGDVLIGVPSTGLHSNGYSLVRRLLIEGEGALPLDRDPGELGRTLGDELLIPTQIYVRSILDHRPMLKGAAHITGGGLTGNIPRMLPEGRQAVLDRGSWWVPPIFALLQARGSLTEVEMLRTFNCGLGLVVAVAPEHADAVAAGMGGFRVGVIAAGDAEEVALR